MDNSTRRPTLADRVRGVPAPAAPQPPVSQWVRRAQAGTLPAKEVTR